MMPNANIMKFQLSPFIVLFVSLNSILIFCASRKIDPKKKPSSVKMHTIRNSAVKPEDNLDSHDIDTSLKTNNRKQANIYH